MNKKPNGKDHALVNEYIQSLYLKKAFEIDLSKTEVLKSETIMKLFIQQMIEKIEEDLRRINRDFTLRGIRLKKLKPGYFHCQIRGITEEVHFDPEWMRQQVYEVAKRMLDNVIGENGELV